MKDIRQTFPYAKYMSTVGWNVEKSGNTYVFIKKIPVLGKVIKIQRPEKLIETEIQKLIKKHKPFQILIEPKRQNEELRMKSLGFKTTSPFLPSKTLILDLTKSKKSLLARAKKDARSAINKNNNLKIETVNYKNLGEFRNAWKSSVPKSRYVPTLLQLQALKKAFGSKALFLTTGLPTEASAKVGAIFLIGDKTAYYWMAFTNKSGRDKKYQYRLVWEGISWAKKTGAKVFDFEGIYDQRFPNKSWKGFTHFKKSFGGQEISYPGAYTKYFPYFNINLSLISQNRIAIIFVFIGILTLIFSLTNTEKLVEFATNYPLIAPFLIILWRILGVIIPPIPGGLLALAMIPVFGWFQAYLYGAIGLVVGCSIAFWLARRYGENLVKNFIPLGQIHKLEKKLSEADHFFAFLLIRFTTGPVMDFASYVAGLTKVKFSTFLFATIISILPDALYYYLGDAIYRSFSPFIIIGVIAIIGSLYLAQKLLSKKN